ncbi:MULTISPECIES: cupin domain-containing protein [Cobetia]|uniref:Cupin domain-containing protein n=1 Tax=Cobetia crustatorum TaxID=553385 RepID=A0A558HQG0_9GAMM|nr:MULTISPECIES: cupin domain-containing protein [Cobetia]TVU71367.1 cupin domain-containing protein [Cobetia crustatorum]
MTVKVIDFQSAASVSSHRRLADLPNRVVQGDPHHETRLHFQSSDEGFIAGTWTSTPGKWHAFTQRDEFCYLILGHIRLIAEDGSAQEFRTGDAFLIPDGFKGYWEVLETTTKHFVIRDRHGDDLI